MKAEIPLQPAKYHNWFTSFVWSQIQIAANKVRWTISTSEIVAMAKQMDPVVFDGLHQTTVDGWINCSGERPHWKDSVLRKIDQGNDPGHNKGGSQGVLVCAPYPFIR